MVNGKNSAVTLRKQKTVWRRIFSCWELYVFLLPALIVTIVFHYVPMYGIQLAFKDLIPGRGILESPWVGLKHFQRFFSLDKCWQLIFNTAKTSLLAHFIQFPIPIIFALMLNQVRNGVVKKVIQNISYMPYLFSVVIVISIANVFLSPNTGIVNILIKKMGGEQILFFGHDKYVLPIYIITGIWQGMGYSAIIYIAALAGIDQAQVEAAKIDGASRLQIIRHVEIPAIMNTIVIMFILQWGALFSLGADKMLLLQTDLNLGASEILSTYIYKVGLIEGQFGFSTAVNLFNTVVNLCCVLIINGVANKFTDNSII